MEEVVTTGAISRAKLQSNHHHQQINTQFLQAGCPSCRPTNSVKALKGNITFHGLAYQSSPGSLPTLSLATNSSWLPWRRVAMPLISPLMPVPQTFLAVLWFTNGQQSGCHYPGVVKSTTTKSFVNRTIIAVGSWKSNDRHTHTHTHTYTYPRLVVRFVVF